MTAGGRSSGPSTPTPTYLDKGMHLSPVADQDKVMLRPSRFRGNEKALLEAARPARAWWAGRRYATQSGAPTNRSSAAIFDGLHERQAGTRHSMSATPSNSLAFSVCISGGR